MQYAGFIGPSSRVQSSVADCERTVNLYLEPNDVQLGLPALLSFPGLSNFITGITDIGARGMAAMNGRAFSVMRAWLHELRADMTETRIGEMALDERPAQFAFNGISGNQAAISSGGSVYVLNLTTNVLSAAVLTNEATQIGMLDGYGLAFNRLNGKLRLSGLNDFSTWDPTEFALRSSAPDNWQAMLVNSPDVWLIGSQSGDVWYDAGTSPFPLAPRSGASFPYGIAAPFSITAAGDSVFWLSQNSQGAGFVVRARGYTPQPINSYALDNAIADYVRDSIISDAEAMTFQWSGHTFYVLRFPAANATWAYDLRTGQWTELGKWNPLRGDFDVWTPRATAYAFGKHLVGNAVDGTISFFDASVGTEPDGTAIIRLRIPPALVAADGERLFVDRFELVLDHGLGTATGQGSDPVAMLRFSQNYGKTWGTERTASLGKQGQYDAQTYWTRCGSSLTSLVPEVRISDPIPVRIVGAKVDARGVKGGR